MKDIIVSSDNKFYKLLKKLQLRENTAIIPSLTLVKEKNLLNTFNEECL